MKKRITRIAVVFLGALLAAFSLSDHALCAEKARQKNPAPRYTNPLLRHVKFKELRPFKALISKKIDEAIKNGEVEAAAIYFRSLSEGMWFGIAEREAFAPSSILKIPIMMTYYKLAERDPAMLRKKLRYVVDSQEESAETLASHSAVPGKYYTVDKLIEFMIAESDNSAATLLTQNLPSQYFIDVFGVFGVNVSGKEAKDSFVSLKISASLLRVLYNASYLNEEFSERALWHLSKSTFKHGIRAGVPAGYAVANKFGIKSLEAQGQKQLHDVAIVYYPGNPYLLAVMTKGSGDDYSKLSKLIKVISEITFREVSSQHEDKSDTGKAIID